MSRQIVFSAPEYNRPAGWPGLAFCDYGWLFARHHFNIGAKVSSSMVFRWLGLDRDDDAADLVGCLTGYFQIEPAQPLHIDTRHMTLLLAT